MFQRDVKMTDAEKAELKKDILAVTPVVVKPAKPKKDKLSPKAQELKRLIESIPTDWSGNKKVFIKNLMEVVIDEKLEVSPYITGLPRLKDTNFKRFVAVVPEENNGDHRYKLGEMTLVVKDYNDQCLMSNGLVENHLLPSDCRYATVDEIDTFLDNLQKNVDALNIVRLLNGG